MVLNPKDQYREHTITYSVTVKSRVISFSESEYDEQVDKRMAEIEAHLKSEGYTVAAIDVMDSDEDTRDYPYDEDDRG